MTSPIQEQQKTIGAIPVPAKRDWCCGTPITGPHVPGCAYAPSEDDAFQPPAADPHEGSAPAAPSAEWEAAAAPTLAEAAGIIDRKYGFMKAAEIDVELPSGSLVRVRKLRKMQVIELKVMDILDGFAPDLLKDINGDDPEKSALAQEEAMRAMIDPETSGKVFGPVDRVVAAAVVCPTVVLEGPTTDDQINVGEVEVEDKMAIFDAAMPDELKTAALGEQLSALKSVRGSEVGVRDLRDGEVVLPEAE